MAAHRGAPDAIAKPSSLKSMMLNLLHVMM
jgi:hypothetical protein